MFRREECLKDLNLITLGQTADLLKISRPTLSKMIHEGKIPQPIQVGRRQKYDKDDLIAYFKGAIR